MNICGGTRASCWNCRHGGSPHDWCKAYGGTSGLLVLARVDHGRCTEEMFLDREYEQKDGRGNLWTSRTVSRPRCSAKLMWNLNRGPFRRTVIALQASFSGVATYLIARFVLVPTAVAAPRKPLSDAAAVPGELVALRT